MFFLVTHRVPCEFRSSSLGTSKEEEEEKDQVLCFASIVYHRGRVCTPLVLSFYFLLSSGL